MTKINKVGYVVLVVAFSVVFNTIFDGFIVPLILTILSGAGIVLLKEDERKTACLSAHDSEYVDQIFDEQEAKRDEER